MVSTDSCLAVSIKLHVFTTRISASSGWAVSRAPARSSRPIITSESTRFLGQPREIKPTEGAVGGGFLLTVLLYRVSDLPGRMQRSLTPLVDQGMGLVMGGKIDECGALRNVPPPIPPGPEGSNGNGLVRAQ